MTGAPIGGVARFRWTQGGRGEARGFSAGSYGPAPALATQSFLDSYGARMGDTVQLSTQSTRLEVQVVELDRLHPDHVSERMIRS